MPVKNDYCSCIYQIPLVIVRFPQGVRTIRDQTDIKIEAICKNCMAKLKEIEKR